MHHIKPCACCGESDDIMFRPHWSPHQIDICLTCLIRFNAEIILRKDELQQVREEFARNRGEVA